MSTIKKQFIAASDVAKLITYHESRSNYNTVYGGIKEADKPWKPLTTMTIREVLQWQDSLKGKTKSTAAGAWQIIKGTLRGNYRKAGLTLDDLFNEENQDRIALQLMKNRYLDDYLSGEIDIYTFGNNLAKEWASLPVVKDTIRTYNDETIHIKAGDSYWSGVAGNKAHASVEEFLTALSKLKEAPAEKQARKTVLETKTGKLGAAVIAAGATSELDIDNLLSQVGVLSGYVEKLQGITFIQGLVIVLIGGCVIYNRHVDMKDGRR